MRKLILLSWFLSLGAYAADGATVHGMVIFGKDKIYLNHLPMWHNPHDYQVILEAKLTPEAHKTFKEHQEGAEKRKRYTFVPEEFSLPQKVRELSLIGAADIVAGHFEKPAEKPKEIVPQTPVELVKVIFFGRIRKSTPAPKHARYFLFGSGSEKFLAHVVTGAPNFEHLLQVEIENEEVLDLLENSPAVTLEFPHQPDTMPTRGGKARVLGGTLETNVKVLNDFHRNFEDLPR